jgi:hypothetical protein
MSEPTEKEQVVSEAINTIVNNLNAFGGAEVIEKAITDTLNNEHRTLQQNFFRHVIKPVVSMYAENHESNNFDLRNQASCECASEMKKVMDDHGLPYV